MRGVLIALCVGLAGCTAGNVPGPVVLISPAVTPSEAAKVRIAVKDRQIRVTAEAGVKEVDFADAAAHVELTGGQRLIVSFDSRSNLFHVEVREDAANPIDIEIGGATIHATKGDIFDATVTGEHLDVAVQQGVVQVTGPDGRSQEVTQGTQVLVAAAGAGAIHGLPPKSPLQAPGPKRPPPDPRRPLIIDRTDIAPAP